ncbi:MAG: TRAP transporter fused permease subunit, partial [Chloroflexota bacterium]
MASTSDLNKFMEKDRDLDLGRRRFTGRMSLAVKVLAILTSLYHLSYSVGVFSWFGVYLQLGTHRGISFSLIAALIFLLTPALKRSPRHRVPWYDYLIIVLAAVPSIYFAVNYTALVYRSNMATLFEAWMGLVLLLVVLEGARRVVGLILAIIGTVFLLYPFVSQFMPGLLYARAHSFTRIMEVMYFYPAGVFGGTYHIIATTVIAYMIFGAFLQVSGAGKFFINLALALLGGVRGGPAKVAVASSAFFASISGSAVANVASTGVITIPMMKSIGYKPHFAGAVESVASNGGPLTPPVMAAVAFIIADFLGITYLDVIIAAALPAFLYYLACFIMVDLEAAKTGLKGLPREQLPSFGQVFKDGWPYFLPLVILIYFLAVMRYSAETSSYYSIGAFILVSWFKKGTRLYPKDILKALADGATAMLSVVAAVGIAGILMAALEVTGLSLGLSGAIVNLFYGNKVGLLLMSAVFCLILGMGATTTAVYLLAAIIVVPALTMVGINPLVAHFFVFYMAQASMITPPICLVAYVAASIAQTSFWKVGFTAVRLGIVILILPFIFVYSPELLIVGSPGSVALAVVTAIMG